MKIAIISSSVRANRDGARVALFTKNILETKNWETTLLDPMELDFPLLTLMYKQMTNPEEKYKTVHKILDEADGFVLVTAEYNHSVPPALKNLLDYYREEYYWKPSGIISYSSGPFGGVRATEHLRNICAELKCLAIPTSLPISKVHESINEDGTSVNGDYERRAKKFLDEFEWYLEALKNQRDKKKPY